METDDDKWLARKRFAERIRSIRKEMPPAGRAHGPTRYKRDKSWKNERNWQDE